MILNQIHQNQNNFNPKNYASIDTENCLFIDSAKKFSKMQLKALTTNSKLNSGI